MRKTFVANVAYVAIIALLFLPLLPHLATFVLGDPQNDIWPSIWSSWWSTENLGSILRLDTFTTKLFYPVGINVHTHSPVLLSSFFPSPFLLFAGPALSWNLALYSIMVLNCIAMFFLALHVLGERFPSFIAGLIFGVNAYVLGHVHNGSMDHVGMFFIPLTALAILHLVETPNIKSALITSLVLLLATLSSWYYGLYLCIFALIYLTGAAFAASRQQFGRLLTWASISGVLYTLVTLPILYPITRNTLFARSTHSISKAQGHFMMDIMQFFIPGKHPAAEERTYMMPVYIGFLVLFLCAFALFRRRERRAWILLGLAAIFMVLSLGSHLFVFGTHYESVPLPSVLLPIFATYRAHAITQAILALLAGMGAAKLVSFFGARWWRRTVMIVLPVLLIGEVLVLSPGPFPFPSTDMSIPTVYEELARDQEDYAIIEVPFDFWNHQFCGRYQYYQIFHQKNLVAGESYFPPFEGTGENWRYIENSPVLTFMLFDATLGSSPSEDVAPETWAADLQQLADDGFRYLLVHRDDITPDGLEEVDAFLQAYLGPHARKTIDGTDLWSLPARDQSHLAGAY